MKKIFIVLFLFFLSGCKLFDDMYNEWADKKQQREYFSNHKLSYYDFGDFSGYESDEDKIFFMVSAIRHKVPKYQETDDLPDPEEILEDGYTYCAGFALLLMNVMFVEENMEASIVTTDSSTQTTRTIVNGGWVDHAAILYDDKTYSTQSGLEIEIKIGYIYTLKEVFSASFQ